MLNALKNLFTLDPAGANRLTGVEEPSAEHMLPAAAAMLLLEVAWADHNMSDDEIARIEQSLKQLFELSDPFVTQLINDARAKHDESVGVYDYTRTINDALNEDEKFQLLVQLWRLALSDQDLHALEEHVIRRISELLYLSHSRFIAAKQQARSL